MSKIKQPKEKINFNLIPDFEFARFEDKLVQSNAKSAIPKLLETGDLKYLERLASHQPLYMEEVFWRQIRQWKIVIYESLLVDHVSELHGNKLSDEDRKYCKEAGRTAWKCLDVVVEGLKNCVYPLHLKKGKGAPKKTIPPAYIKTEDLDLKYLYKEFPVLTKYKIIQNELKRQGLHSTEQLREKEKDKTNKEEELKKEKDKGKQAAMSTAIKKLKQEIKDDKQRVIRKLTEYIEKFDLSEKQIQQLTNKTFSEIAITFLAKTENTSEKTIRRNITEERKRASQDNFESVRDFFGIEIDEQSL